MYLKKIILLYTLLLCFANVCKTFSIQALSEGQASSKDALRPVQLNEARLFATECLGIIPELIEITEVKKWERFINKGKPGSQIFLVKTGEKEYIVKASKRTKREFNASVKMSRILQKSRDLGNLEIVIPYQLGIFKEDVRQFIDFIDLNDPLADIDHFEENLEDENIFLFQIMSKVDGMMLGDLFNNLDKMTIDQLRYMGFVLGSGLANLHKIGYAENGISQTVHRDMHPGQIFIDWEDVICTVIDFDRTNKGNVSSDFNRIIGRIMDDYLGKANKNHIIAYVYGFFEGYHSVLPEALDFNENGTMLEFFGQTSFIPISITMALTDQFYTPIQSSNIERSTLSRTNADMLRVICSDLPHEEKLRLLSQKTSDGKYKYGLIMARSICEYLGDNPSSEKLEGLINALDNVTKEYNDLCFEALRTLPAGEWLDNETHDKIMKTITNLFDTRLLFEANISE